MHASFSTDVGPMGAVLWCNSHPVPSYPRLQVSSFLLQGHTRGSDTGSSQWALQPGVVRVNGTTVLCFSRPESSSVPMTLHQVNSWCSRLVGSPHNQLWQARQWADSCWLVPQLYPSQRSVGAGAGMAAGQHTPASMHKPSPLLPLNISHASQPHPSPHACMQELDPASIPLNYAAAPFADLNTVHTISGSLTINAVKGSAGGGAGGGASTAILAHAVLMLAAFGGLMPLGAILARHKWAFGRQEVRMGAVCGRVRLRRCGRVLNGVMRRWVFIGVMQLRPPCSAGSGRAGRQQLRGARAL